MVGGVREFLRTKGGRVVAIVGCCIGLFIVFMVIRSTFGASEAEDVASHRIFVDASTNPPKAFNITLKPGLKIPVMAPSGKETGYPAELCYWTKDGGTKKEPTAVLLNDTVGKSGPTFCPDCGRLVVGHNPAPQPGAKAPPNQEEYKSRRGGSASPSNTRDR
jgi:hypothetical protein